MNKKKTAELDKRMKEYEMRNRYYLQRRTPVIVRVDGRAFHTLLRNFKKPFDEVFQTTMQETAKYLCENVQNCKIAYTQSDEITLLLVDYDKLNTHAFFEYRVDKLCSIIASMATFAFNKFLAKNVANAPNDDFLSAYYKALEMGGLFDARVFNLPKEEVTNCFFWRQQDATKNSIQSVGQYYFTESELKSKSTNKIQDMLFLDKGINLNNFPTYQKRGSCVIKEEYAINESGEEVEIDYITDVNEPTEDVTFRTRWVIDREIPIFKSDGREYIERYVRF